MSTIWISQAALEKVQRKVAKLEKELYAKGEPRTAQKPEGSKAFRRESTKLEDTVMKAEPQTTQWPGGPMLDVGELMTPVASRQGDDDWKNTDETVSLYSGNLASRTKWEQLKLQVLFCQACPVRRVFIWGNRWLFKLAINSYCAWRFDGLQIHTYQSG